MLFVPLIARMGADTSSDKLRRCARYTVCGNKGATLQHRGWVDSVIGFQPFLMRSAKVIHPMNGGA
jgi:hypothetical protein